MGKSSCLFTFDGDGEGANVLNAPPPPVPPLKENYSKLNFISYFQSKRTDCNHIFLNFVPTVTMDPVKAEDSLRGMISRYGARLWKLRVPQLEIKLCVK